MIKPIINLIIILLVILVFTVPASSQRFDPHLDWREMDTGHFLIIYNSPLKNIALEVAFLAEEILPKIEAFLNTTLSFRPAIVLIDHTDIPNGYTDPLQGEIHIVISQPYNQFLGSRFRNWLQMVLYHEMTHLLHLEAASPEILHWREILGYVVLPNIIQPMWAWEGYAMYGENNFGTLGRPTETLYDMYLREIALDDHFEPPHLLAGYDYLDRWPAQNGCYIYGASICQFIADRYGEEKLGEISYYRSNNFQINGFELALKKALGLNIEELWSFWKTELKKKYQEQFKKINREGITPCIFLTERGYNVSGVNLSPDGEKLIYSFIHPQYISGLRIQDRANAEEHLVVRGIIAGKPAFSHDGTQIVYSKMVSSRYSSWFDIYQYNFKTGKEKRLTYENRAFSPVFQGSRILFLKRNVFPEGLYTLDPQTGKTDLVYEFQPEFSPNQIAIDPLGKKIVLSGWHNGYLDLALLQKDGTLYFLTSDHWADISPTFSADGETLFFSSDRSGIYNVYAYSLASNDFFRVTNVLTGLFEPVYSQNQFFGISYHKDGFDVVEFYPDPVRWKSVVIKPENLASSEIPEVIYQNYKDQPYQPVKHLFPRYWVPLLFGFSTSARDYLGFHSYALSYQNDLSGNFTIKFSYQGLFADPELDFWTTIDQEKYQYSIALSSPVNLSGRGKFTFQAGYERIYREDSLSPGFWQGFFLSGNLSLLGGNDSWINTQSFNLTYRQGKYNFYPIQKGVFTWSTQFSRAGNTDHTWYASLAVGYSTLAQDFVLGGRESFWSVAGYPEESRRGKIAGRFELGYNFPVMIIDQPLLSMGLIKALYGKIYWVEAGAGEQFDSLEWIGSVGTELRLRNYISDEIPIDLTLGYAQPLQVDLSGEWYLTLGIRFR